MERDTNEDTLVLYVDGDKSVSRTEEQGSTRRLVARYQHYYQGSCRSSVNLHVFHLFCELGGEEKLQNLHFHTKKSIYFNR